MKYGKIKINEISESDKEEILKEIVEDCILFAGDSYSDFAKSVTKMLVSKKIVEYAD